MPHLEDLPIGGSRQFNLAVVSVDIRGFTRLSLDLQKEIHKLARLQALYLTEMSAIFRERGGITEKYTGDGVLGLFGTESDTTGARDVLNACSSALDVNLLLEKSINPYLEASGLPQIRCGQGVDYGAVWMERVGLRGENQFSLAGPTVSLAAKLQGDASAGKIFVGKDVQSRLPQKWKDFCKGPIKWSQPYEAYELSAQWT